MPVDELVAEVAEAEAAGLKAEDIANLRGQVEGASAIMGMGMAYTVPDADKAAWVPAWRLVLDHAGVERGKPVPLPKDRLGHYLSKRREIDGGRLFTLKMPEHLAGERKFQCFVVPDVCAHRTDTKSNLIDHMENAHPRESGHYKAQIDMIRDSAHAENTALQDLVRQIAATPDPGGMVVPAKIREEYDAQLPDAPVIEDQVVTVNLPPVHCELCSWPEGVEKWAGKVPPKNALRMHVMVKHREDV